MNPAELNPGQELDIWVAKTVMGAEWKDLGENPHFIKVDGPAHVWAWVIRGYPYASEEEFPRYSTDIGAAWQVVEKLIQENWTVTVKSEESRIYVGRRTFWYSAEYEQKDGIQALGGSFDGAPHAICLGALKTLETQK